MRRFDGFSVFALFALSCFAVLAIVHREVADASEDAVARSMRYDVSWTGANGRIEAAHLEKYVARYAALAKPSDAENSKLFYQILLGRLETWDSGGYKAFLDLSPDRRARFKRLRRNIEKLAPEFGNLESPDSQSRILEVLAQMSPEMDRIGGEAHTVAVSEAATVRSDLQEKQQHQNWLMFALIVSGVALLALTVRQNGHLRRANKTISNSAAHMSDLAKHDALTGLRNRFALEEYFNELVQDPGNNDRIAVLAIDLDGFKAVNDMMGHSGGDALLIATAQTLLETLVEWNPLNSVFRVGGDEFIAIALIERDADDIVSLGTDLAKRFERPLDTAYGNILVELSVGIAAQSGPLQPEILKDADLALTHAKSLGRGLVFEFDNRLRDDLHRRIELEVELKKAISRGEIVPFYQPQFDLTTGAVVGFEALARWHHPRLGFISPDQFIPIAESCGEIVTIGRSILERACLDAQSFPEASTVSVNCSVVEILREDAVKCIGEILTKTKLPPHRLKLEVTESVMMTDLESVLTTFRALKELGVAISLDDFGTGYSALSYLTKFKWDELKIDRHFVESALTDPINRTIIRSVRVLANVLDAQVVAEGLETSEQKDLLAKIGCNVGQGYLLGRPMPRDEVFTLVSSQADKAVATHNIPEKRVV